MAGDEAADSACEAFVAVTRHPDPVPADEDTSPVWPHALARAEYVWRVPSSACRRRHADPLMARVARPESGGEAEDGGTPDTRDSAPTGGRDRSVHAGSRVCSGTRPLRPSPSRQRTSWPYVPIVRADRSERTERALLRTGRNRLLATAGSAGEPGPGRADSGTIRPADHHPADHTRPTTSPANTGVPLPPGGEDPLLSPAPPRRSVHARRPTTPHRRPTRRLLRAGSPPAGAPDPRRHTPVAHGILIPVPAAARPGVRVPPRRRSDEL